MEIAKVGDVGGGWPETQYSKGSCPPLTWWQAMVAEIGAIGTNFEVLDRFSSRANLRDAVLGAGLPTSTDF